MSDIVLEYGVKTFVVTTVGLLLVGSALYAWGVIPSTAVPGLAKDQWQAVFLSNNQVYFGKLSNESPSYVTLRNVYYLRTASDLQDSREGSNLNLIKLGGEVHGPEDVMYIPKTSIVFWENLKDTSRIVQSIVGSTR
jgi:hypothetical protein